MYRMSSADATGFVLKAMSSTMPTAIVQSKKRRKDRSPLAGVVAFFLSIKQ
jgi:hypothetical protein